MGSSFPTPVSNGTFDSTCNKLGRLSRLPSVLPRFPSPVDQSDWIAAISRPNPSEPNSPAEFSGRKPKSAWLTLNIRYFRDSYPKSKLVSYTGETRTCVAFKRSFLFEEIHVGNTIELTWPSVRSSVLKCISITNTNVEKVEFSRFGCAPRVMISTILHQF